MGSGGLYGGAWRCFRGLVTLMHLQTIYNPVQGVLTLLEERTGDYCDTETFKADCPEDEVIVMSRARYGRIKVGRCVEYDLGYINCYSDVLIRMDRRCSGRRTCEIRIPDAEFESTGPCLKELKTYLEVAYYCVPVETASSDYCSSHSYANLTLSSGYIISDFMTSPDRSLCDHTIYPWVIVAHRGQYINLTLYDFGLDNAYGTSIQRPGSAANEDKICRQYGWLEDSGAERPSRICGGDHRVSEVYSSRGNIVKIWTGAGQAPRDQIKFLIRYTVIGCPDPDVLPDQSWFERSRDGYASIGCQNGEVKWIVQCIDNAWKGSVGNCSFAHQQTNEEFMLTEEMTMPYGLAIGIGAVIGVLIALVIVLVIGCRSRPDVETISQKRSSVQMNYLESHYDKAAIKCSCGFAARVPPTESQNADSATGIVTPASPISGDRLRDYRFGPPQLCCPSFPHHHFHENQIQEEPSLVNCADSAQPRQLCEQIWESPLSRIESAPSGSGSPRDSAVDHVFTVVAVSESNVRPAQNAAVVSLTPQKEKAPCAFTGVGATGRDGWMEKGELGGGGRQERARGTRAIRGKEEERDRSGGEFTYISDYGTRCSGYSTLERYSHRKQLLQQQQQQQQQQGQQRKMDV